MYHCYLRGKQFELKAIREAIPKIVSSEITPIIEPVRYAPRDLLKCIEELCEAGAQAIVIANPYEGEMAGNQARSESIIDQVIEKSPEIELGFIVDEGTALGQVYYFIEKYSSQNFSIIHNGRFGDITSLEKSLNGVNGFNKHIFIKEECSKSYRDGFCGSSRVLIEDCFNRRSPNAEYSKKLNEFFSDLYLNYQEFEGGYSGFGDFSIIGDHFSEGGGQAITAVLHVTYNEGDEINIRHFLSDPRTVAEDVPILLEEALARLQEFLEERPDILEWSESCQQLMDIYEQGCQSNLAMMKKLTMKHHFELMNHLIG